MLQNIRDKSQGIFAWVIAALLIGSFALWGVHSYVGNEKNGDAAAYVNHKPILQSEVNNVYQRMRQQRQMQLGADFSLSPSAEAELKKQALNQLILSQTLVTAAYKAGYRVTINQVDEALKKIPAFQVNGQFSTDRFHDILNSILYSQDQFLTDMRSTMLINQVQGGYVNSAFALPSEINTAINLVNQKRDISYLIIPAARFSKNIVISPDEINQYYKTHPKEFLSPEQVSIEYLQLSLNDIKSKLHVDPVKLQQYYQNHLSNYTKPAQWHTAVILIKLPENASLAETAQAEQKANNIYAQLKAGKPFNGQKLKWFSAGTLDPDFEKATTALQKTGDISPPVKTAYGISIIKLLGQKKAEVQPFAQVKTQIEDTLAQQQAEQLFSQQSDKLSNLTYAHPESLAAAAKTLGLAIQTTGLFDRTVSTKNNGIISNPRVVNAAFSPDVLQQGNNSDLLQLDPNTAVVLRIKQHQPASTLPLAEVKTTLQAILRHQKAQQAAQQFGEQLMAQIQKTYTNLTKSKLPKPLSLSWQEAKNAGRYDAKIGSFILNQAFQMPRPDNSHISVKGVTLPSGDYALIRLNAVYDGVLPPDGDIQRHIFQEEAENNMGNIEYQLYVHELMKKANIKLR